VKQQRRVRLWRDERAFRSSSLPNGGGGGRAAAAAVPGRPAAGCAGCRTSRNSFHCSAPLLRTLGPVAQYRATFASEQALPTQKTAPPPLKIRRPSAFWCSAAASNRSPDLGASRGARFGAQNGLGGMPDCQ
jgi:hypothetical protein